MSDALSNITISGVLTNGRFSTVDQLANNAPVLSNPISNQSATVGSIFTFQFPSNTFIDADGDQMTYTAELSGGGQLPGWLAFTPSTRTFSGTPLLASVGTLSINVTADDGFDSVSDTFDLVIAEAGAGTIIARADWSIHGMTPNQLAGQNATWTHWDTGGASFAQISNFVRGTYPSTIGSSANGGFVVNIESYQAQEIYVEMKVRYPNPAPAKQGLKFLKFFGADGDGVTTFDSANFTFNPQYDNNGTWDWVAFGDGTITANDTANTIYFVEPSEWWLQDAKGRNKNALGFSVSRPANSNFAFDDNWHTIRCIAKYNSGSTAGNETNDGRFYVNIDGTTYIDATGVWNSHYSNKKFFKTIEFFGWTQNTQAFAIDYADIKISTGGWV